VPWRSSMRTRLLATSILIALGSVGVTAWLVGTTTTAVVRPQPTVLANDATVYNTLLSYAATHREWTGVPGVVSAMGRISGRQITLTTTGRQRIAASAASRGPLPSQPSAVVNPLQVDTSLVAGADTDGIADRVVGPYLLTRTEKSVLDQETAKSVLCLRRSNYGVTETASASGRPTIHVTDSEIKIPWSETCGVPALSRPMPTEQAALTALNRMVNSCLAQAHRGQVIVDLGFSWFFVATRSSDDPSSALVQSCLQAGLQTQLKPYVAPPALLFITGPPGQATRLGVSAAGRIRIAEVTALILLAVVIVTVITSTRLVRPLSRLTAAVQESSGPPRPLPVTSGGEIGRLTAAFNDFAERRQRMEAQRTAMVSDIAHELRTPLQNIRGWVEAAEDGLAVSDQAYRASLLEEAILLQRIIDDLQHLADADAGRFRLHPEPVHLRDLLDQVASAHRAAAAVAGITLDVQVESDPEIVADPVRIRQAVGNLVVNALRHGLTGTIITIRCRETEPGAVIQVMDTGPGIAAEDLPKIFDRFWRAEKSRSRRTGGSGLGLPISRQLIEAHGGTISAASVLGEGTVFTIVLPRFAARPGES
jgi:two-component system, OmpR family, sensor histidine kinase BaeS